MDSMRARLPKTLQFSSDGLPRRVIISYILDYAILVILFIVFQALDAVEPFHQHFALQNYTLQYPYAIHERVPIALAFAVAVIAPIIVIAIYTLVIDGIYSHQLSRGTPKSGGMGRYTLRERLWEFNCGVLGLLLSEGAAFVITGALKNATGKPRPDLIARCLPKAGSIDPPVFGLSNSTICTQTDHAILKDGFRSFPSGHSSSAFAGLFYLSLYLAAKLHALDNKGEVWKTFIVMVPSLGASLIAVSRIMDARHHPFDVISGSFLGILVAWAAYRQYFPPITEPWHKGRAYPIRSWGTEPKKLHYAYVERSNSDSPVDRSRTHHIKAWHDPEAGNLQPRSVQLDPNDPLYSARGRGNPRIPLGHTNDSHIYPSSTSSMELGEIRPGPGGASKRYLYGDSSSGALSRDSSVANMDPDRTPRQPEYPIQPRDFTQDSSYHPQPHLPTEPPDFDYSRFKPAPRLLVQQPSHNGSTGSDTAQDMVEGYICGHCGNQFGREEELARHAREAHPEQRQSVI